MTTARWSKLGAVIGLAWLLLLSMACAAQPEPTPQSFSPNTATLTATSTATSIATLTTEATATPSPTPANTPTATATTSPTPSPTAIAWRDSDLTAALQGDPQALNRLVQAVDGDATRFADRLQNTRSLPQTHSEQWPLWSIEQDLDGDGQAELLFASPAFRLSDEGLTARCHIEGCLGYVSIFENTTQGLSLTHRVQNSLIPDTMLDYPQLERVADLNQDGLSEIIIQETWCGAHTCGLTLTIGRWDGRAWQNLGTVSESYAEVEILDLDADGLVEIRTDGGTVGSVGAGLQRTKTTIYDWQNGVYTRTETIPHPRDHPYFLLLDAHRALQNEQPETARQRLERLLAGPAVSDDPAGFMDARSENRIRSFGLVLQMLTQALAPEPDQAAMQNSLTQLQTDYAQPDNPYLPAAESLWQTWQNTQDALAACQAMAAVIQSRPTEAEFFEWYGYATERLDLSDPKAICPLEPAT